MSNRVDYFSITDPQTKEAATQLIIKLQNKIMYSDKYYDDENEYRHVILPREIGKLVPRHRLMSENEWRSIGVQQSLGWIHYLIHKPEPHVLLFKRKLK